VCVQRRAAPAPVAIRFTARRGLRNLNHAARPSRIASTPAAETGSPFFSTRRRNSPHPHSVADGRRRTVVLSEIFWGLCGKNLFGSFSRTTGNVPTTKKGPQLRGKPAAGPWRKSRKLVCSPQATTPVEIFQLGFGRLCLWTNSIVSFRGARS